MSKEIASKVFANYKELVKLNKQAEAKMLQLLLHPECTDEMALQVIRARREATAQMAKVREQVRQAMYKGGMVLEANLYF